MVSPALKLAQERVAIKLLIDELEKIIRKEKLYKLSKIVVQLWNILDTADQTPEF